MLTTRRLLFSICGIFFFSSFIFGKKIRTPWQGEGPFYPDKIPKDTDYNLLKNGESNIEAGGKILNLRGILVDIYNRPLKGVVVEIWQTDMNGVYLHSQSFGIKERDKKFQGFGRSITNKNGHFYFRTIIPASYSGRAPHIHLKLLSDKSNILTTQLYIHSHPLNEKDFLFRSMDKYEQEINSMKISHVKKRNTNEYNTSVTLIV